MKRQLPIYILATVAIFAAVAFYWWPRLPERKRVELASPAVQPARPTAAPPQDSTVFSAGSAQGMNFDSISTFSKMTASSNRLPKGQALEYTRSAALYCEARATMARRPPKVGTNPSSAKAEAFHRAFANRFCDVSVDSDETATQMAALSADDEVVQAHMLMNLEGAEVEEVAVPAAKRLVSDSASPDAVVRAAQFLLQQQGLDLPQTSKLPVPPSIQGNGRSEVQMLAVTITACRMRGGCGPNGLYTTLGCGTDCRPGVSLADIWRNQFSPEALAYAYALAGELRPDLARGRQGP